MISRTKPLRTSDRTNCPHSVGASICRHCSGYDVLLRRVEELETAIDDCRRALADRRDAADALTALCAVRDEVSSRGPSQK